MAADFQAEVDRLRWFHQIDFGNGVISRGIIPITHLRAQADIYFRDGIEGQTLLDVGCWDGFNSFEAYRRGASRVLATDHFVWSDKGSGNRDSFEFARAHLAPAVEVRDIDLPQLTLDAVGEFNVVLFAGVLYHLRHPFLALEGLAPLARSTLIIETYMDARDEERPMMVFYPGSELGGDETNWWAPNRPCVEAMLHDVGFSRITFTQHPAEADRGIFHAYR